MKTKKFSISTLLIALGVTITSVANNNLFPEKFMEDAPAASGQSFDETTRIVNVGIGLGRRYVATSALAGYTYGQTPVISVSYEQPWKKRVGPGYLGVGGYLGFQRAHFDYKSPLNGFEYNNSWNYILHTARAAWHWDKLNKEKSDIYIGALAGLRIQTHNFSTTDPSPLANTLYNVNTSGSVLPSWGTFIGARYYFSPKFGVYAEAGAGASFLTVGASIKL